MPSRKSQKSPASANNRQNSRENLRPEDSVVEEVVSLDDGNTTNNSAPLLSAPIPRPPRRRQKSKLDRGIPNDSDLACLAEAYLERQRRNYPVAAKSGVVAAPSSETIQAMVEDFKRRHRGGAVEVDQIKALLKKVGASKAGGAYIPVLQSLPHREDGLVFHGPRGGRVKPDTVRNIFIKDVLAPLKRQFPAAPGEVGFEHGRLHSFRHFFCSQCANGGVKERVLMTWLGHADAKMVRRYYHLDDEESQRQMNRVSIRVVNAGDVAGVGNINEETNPAITVDED